MILEQLLRIITNIDSPETLRSALEQLQLRVDQNLQGADAETTRNAITHLEVAELRFSRDAAIRQAFLHSTEPCLVFSGKVCLAATAGARQLFNVGNEDQIPVKALRQLGKLADQCGGTQESEWTSPDGLAFVVSVTQAGTMKVVKLCSCNGSDEALARKMNLSPKQSIVLALVGKGLSDKAIAEHMGCSVHTVRTHLRALNKKLGVSGRVEALIAVRSERPKP